MSIQTQEFIVPRPLRNSPTMTANKPVALAKAKGITVQDVTVGDLYPKPTETEVDRWVDAVLAKALEPESKGDAKFVGLEERSGRRRYAYSDPAGLPLLNATAAECFTRDTGIPAEASDVEVGAGGKATLNGALYTFEPGEVILMATPCWPSNFDIFPQDVKIVPIPTTDGILHADLLKEALAKYPNPAAILINAPCNPTGANYTREEREAFFETVNKETKNTVVLSDDPYGKLVYDQQPYDIATVLQRGPQEKTTFADRRLAVFRTVSKEYGLAGLRVGYMVTRCERLLDSLKKWNECKAGNGVENQLKAQGALLYGDEFIKQTVQELTEKRKILMDGIRELKCADMDPPRGTIYGWIDFSKLKGKAVPAKDHTGEGYVITTPRDMMRYLIEEAKVCPVEGGPFYAPNALQATEGDWHVRLTFSGDKTQVQTVVASLKAAEASLTNPQDWVNGAQGTRTAAG